MYLPLIFALSTASASHPVKLDTSDGQRIVAQSWKVRGSERGVILVHGEGQNSTVWNSTAQVLAEMGITSSAK